MDTQIQNFKVQIQNSTVICSDTKRLEVLIVLHICSFFMSYDTDYTSLGDSETIISYSHIKQLVLRDVLWLLWDSLIFNCIISSDR